jgi:hypothetical protein
MVAIERHGLDHVGQWFQPSDVFPGNEGIQQKKRRIASVLFGRGVVEDREITCLVGDDGLWMSLNPRMSLGEHFKSREVAR